jgi:hypothetical protein
MWASGSDRSTWNGQRNVLPLQPKEVEHPSEHRDGNDRDARGFICAFGELDLDQVVELYRRVFAEASSFSSQQLKERFRNILLENPWYDPSLPSFVYKKEGKIVGFLGVLVRRMVLGQKPIRVAVSSHYMVDPASRTTLAGVELMRAFLAGPQDVCLAEAGEASRRIWEGLGGTTSLVYSLDWTRILRPSHYAVYQMKKRGLPLQLAWIGRSFGTFADMLANRLKYSPFRQTEQGPQEELSNEDLLRGISGFPRQSGLRPQYDEYSLNWLLDVLGRKTALGKLQKMAVRNANQELIGWYLYYLKPGGVSRVLQVIARPGSFENVLRHLFYHAWRRGVVALVGRVEPHHLRDLSANHCMLNCSSWMLLHARRPELLEALHRDDAFFTPLEGEFWISIDGEPPQ